MNIFKKVLKNGLTILVRPVKNIPKVSLQMWYDVGSKDENSNEKGLAHLLEHMIFKGTETMSESDINMITHKLSGNCNAFTSYDYTGYLFDMPSQHWKEALAMLADCMSNCTFKEDLLNSELKAVIQELKMYKDDYSSSLVEKMISNMFHGHPYQHPIIGYKQDLCNITRENLLNFYKKHYIPNNATLVVVGDVDPEEVFEQAGKEFSSVKPNFEHTKQDFILEKDLYGSSTVIYRDVQMPVVALAFVIPGAKEKVDYLIDILCLLLAEGKSSRLHKRLVEEEKCVSDIGAFSYDLFDNEVLFLQFEPNDPKDIDKCIDIIKEEIQKLHTSGISDAELKKAQNQVELNFYNLLENNQKQAYAIGKYYLATKDENFIFNYIEKNSDALKEKLNILIKNYLNLTQMHTGKVLSTSKDDSELWSKIQSESDALDNLILSKKDRTSDVEPGHLVNTIEARNTPKFNFPKAQINTLKNGLEVLIYENKNVPKIDLLIDLKAKFYYDSKELEGIGNFVSEMLMEGTDKYSNTELAEILESLGIELEISTGFINMSLLSKDLEKGLEVLEEILTNSTFPESSIEKIRTKIKNQIKNFWDQNTYIADQLIKDQIYVDHPYSKNLLGNLESINKITRNDLIDYYKKYISPVESRAAIVGDFQGKNIIQIIEKYLGAWTGPEIESIVMPELKPIIKDVNYKINRDQVVLAFAGKSINRLHPDYDKALIFDQIYGGGALGTMSSKLFQIRERTGLFYTITGSIISRADLQPGVNLVKTIVSLDRLEEAEKAISKEIEIACSNISNEEIEQAKNAITNSRIDNFASNKSIAGSLLFLRKYNLGENYFDNRNEQITALNKKEILECAQKILSEPMFKVKVGRV